MITRTSSGINPTLASSMRINHLLLLNAFDVYSLASLLTCKPPSFQLLTFLVHRNGSTSGCTMLYPQKSSWNENHQDSWARDNRSAKRFQSEMVAESPVPYSSGSIFKSNQTKQSSLHRRYLRVHKKLSPNPQLIWSLYGLVKSCCMNSGGLCGSHPLSVITPGN